MQKLFLSLLLLLSTFHFSVAQEEVSEDIYCYEISNDDQQRITGNTYTYWYASGHMNGYTNAQQAKAFAESFRQLSEVCGLKFIRVSSASQARLKYYFVPRSGMQIPGTNPPLYALGLHWSNGETWINSTRDVGLLSNPDSPIPIELIKHETMHEWNIQHSTDKSCTMGPSATNPYFCPADVLILQSIFGPPSKIFYPKDKGIVGARVRAGLEKHEELLAKRQLELDKRPRADEPRITLLSRRLLENIDDLIKDSELWWKLNERWRGVPFAHYYQGN